MGDVSGKAAAGLQEILLAVADGLRDAQKRLNQAPPVDSFGRPADRYQIPYLDFSIKVQAENRPQMEQPGAHPMLTLATPVVNVPSLNVNPFDFRFPRSGSGGNEAVDLETTSTLSGRFVAVPAGEGVPLLLLDGEIDDTGGDVVSLSAYLGNTAGETLSDVAVEFNLDQAASRALSAAAGVGLEQDHAWPRLTDGTVRTDHEGAARNQLSLDRQASRGASYLFTLNVGAVATHITLTL